MRQGLQCSEWGKPVPGLELTKLSEPIWTLFFELHAGPWRTTGHDKRPDTRPIEAPSRTVAEKITLPNRGHPHMPLDAVGTPRRLSNPGTTANFVAVLGSYQPVVFCFIAGWRQNPRKYSAQVWDPSPAAGTRLWRLSMLARKRSEGPSRPGLMRVQGPIFRNVFSPALAPRAACRRLERRQPPNRPAS